MPNYVFPKIELPKVGRSNFNLDKSLMFSFAPGTLRVLYAKDVLPKDHWEIDIKAAIESMPMLAPLYGKWKARWSWFFEPYSNIYGWMDNNTRRTSEQIITTNLLVYSLASIAEYKTYSSLGWTGSQPRLEEVLYGNLNLSNFVAGSATIQGQSPYRTVHSAADFNSVLGVASSSIWEDFGWPCNWTGYWESYNSPSSVNLLDPDNLRIVDISENTPALMTASDIIHIDLPNNYIRTPEFLHAIKPFGYLDIIRNYYVNPNFGSVPFIKGNYTDMNYPDTLFEDNIYNSVGVVSQEVLDYIFKFLRNLSVDDYRTHLDKEFAENNFGNIDSIFTMNPPSESSADYVLYQRACDFLRVWSESYATENGGCFLSSYQMDLNKGLMNAETGDFQAKVSVSQGAIAIESFRVQSKLQDLINILDLGRGRFGDWISSLWSVDISGEIDRPVYLGSHTEIIGTTDIISTTSVPNGSVAGQQTGFSAGSIRKHRPIKFNSDQYGVIYCIFDFVPYVSYSRGFKREDIKDKFTDIYNPRMAQIGYQDVPRKVLDAFSPYKTAKYLFTNDNANVEDAPTLVQDIYYGVGDYKKVSNYIPFSTKSSPNDVVGRQVAWAEYMTDVDEVRGDFALENSLENWVLSRSYMVTTSRYTLDIQNPYATLSEDSTHDFDFSTYLHPGEYNSLFVDQRHDAQNFRQFIKFDVFVKRAIPARTLPHI